MKPSQTLTGIIQIHECKLCCAMPYLLRHHRRDWRADVVRKRKNAPSAAGQKRYAHGVVARIRDGGSLRHGTPATVNRTNHIQPLCSHRYRGSLPCRWFATLAEAAPAAVSDQRWRCDIRDDINHHPIVDGRGWSAEDKNRSQVTPLSLSEEQSFSQSQRGTEPITRQTQTNRIFPTRTESNKND